MGFFQILCEIVNSMKFLTFRFAGVLDLEIEKSSFLSVIGKKALLKFFSKSVFQG